MATIRSVNDIVLNLIDFLRTTLPDADTKSGSVIRDLMIDMPASQIGLLYDEMGKVSNLQSLRLVSGSDLDKLAQNFGASRKAAKSSAGIALMTFASIPAVISITKNSLVTASNGATFSVLNGVSVDPAQSNFYKSIATKYQNDLSFLNITDQYAVEVSVKSSTPGSSGNISKYSLNRTSIPGVSNVLNVFPFSGGSDQEDDISFKNRVLSVFSGSNIGTSLGYKNLALTNSSVSDALVIGPGDPLMTRDGTQVQANSDGTTTIVSEGTGGKVDIVILGQTLNQFTDTFIYKDKSNKNDPTDIANDFILGQISTDVNKTITQKRLDDITNGVLPAQPVEDLLEITGTLSGTNFLPKSVDSLDRVSGNYELVKDTSLYAGSPWGFDKLHWVNNQITYQEDRIKTKLNGQDSTTFTDVLQISTVQQNILINNENSNISTSDNSIIQLSHTPATSVTRVVNTNTGERYTVINQNVDGSGSTNNTGRVQISGNTLPSSTDILQVDYLWIVSYDPFSDYDGKILNNNIRNVKDSIDWSMSNIVRNEPVLFTVNASNTFFTGITKLPISSVVNANIISTTSGIIAQSNIVNFTGRLSISLTNLNSSIISIESIALQNSAIELYNTAEADGVIINTRVAVGSQIKYNVVIILPTDTPAISGNYTYIKYNPIDTFNIVNANGSLSGNTITIPFGNVSNSTTSTYMDVSYIASTQDIFTSSITTFPLSRFGNGFAQTSNNGSLNKSLSNVIQRETQTIQLNGSNQLSVDLSVTSTNYALVASQIISVIDIRTGLEIWNGDFPGVITTTLSNNYQLIFSGLNSPALGDNVIVIYNIDDLRRVQPFTYTNTVINKSFATLQSDFVNNKFYIPAHTFTIESGMSFSVIDTATGLTVVSGTDGYISSVSGTSATFASLTFNFGSIDDVLGKILKINHPSNRNNTGAYNITNYISSTDTLTIKLIIDNLNNNQVSIIRIVDNVDLWDAPTCSIDVVNNKLILPNSILASQGDAVITMFYNVKTIRQSPTKLAITAADQTNNSGIFSVQGTTLTKISDIVFTATANGLKQNILEALKTSLGLTSVSSIPSSIKLVRVVKVEKVSATTNNDVLSVLSTYDVDGTSIGNNDFYINEMILNQTLSNTDFILPATLNNLSNATVIGDKLRVTCYYSTSNDYENIYFTKNGILYTNKKFALIDRCYISSGFNTSQSITFTTSYFTQPSTGSRYRSFYTYLAPKQNERILINYNYNSAISDVTLLVESSRPLNADVLVRAAKEVFIDITVNIVVKSDFSNSAAIVLQNVKSKLTTSINTNKLGDILDSSDLIAAAQGVDGVDRVRVLYFNITGSVGQVLSVSAKSDQYFAANNVVVAQESR